MKKRVKGRTSGSRNSFFSNSKNAIIALLLIAAAVTAYSVVNAATVSHSPSAIQPQGAGSGLDADTLQQLSAAAILAAGGGGGGQLKVYKADGTTFAGYFLGFAPAAATSVGKCSGWVLGTASGIVTVSSQNCAEAGMNLYYNTADCTGPPAYIAAGPAYNNGNIYSPRPNFGLMQTYPMGLRYPDGRCEYIDGTYRELYFVSLLGASVCGNGPCTFLP